MKTVQRRLLALLLCGTMLTSFSGCLQGTQGSQEQTPATKSNYTVTYNLNYDGAETRVQSYQAGTTAIDWQALREGFYINGWYTDPDCTQEYEFDEKIDSDLTLYAGWREKPGIATVTFDFGYAGAANKVIELEKGSLINKKYIPSKERFGMRLSGWYTDEEYTNQWNFETDAVTESMVLHAKFDYTVNIPLNSDGSIKYENVSVFIWNGCGSFSSTLLEPVVAAFNEEYQGKINVTYSDTLTNQSDVFLRIQQTTELMRCASTYYPIADIYSLAGIEVKNEDYYAGAVRESESKGVMLQTPFAAVVPYLVYNKTLMNKYSPDGLPTNYSELSAVLQSAAAGEAANTNFNSILATNNWDFKECSSYTAFSQNNADYYTYKNDMWVNEWKDATVMERAKTSLQTTYDLFGVNGLNKGMSVSYDSSAIISNVQNGNALMGLVSWKGSEGNIVNNNKLGVMSLSGMFTDATDEASQRVPVYTIGVAFYNGASNVIADPVRMCASAVFADYLSKHAYLFADQGFVPVHKETAEVDSYANSTDPKVQLLQSVCDPNNYWTLPGMTNVKYLINTVAAEGIIVPYLKNQEADRDDVTYQLNRLYSQVGGLLS